MDQVWRDKMTGFRNFLLLAFALAFTAAVSADLRAGSPQPHMSVPIAFDRDDRTESPRIMLTVFGEEREFLFDTGTNPTMLFQSPAAALQDKLRSFAADGEGYRNIPLEGKLAGARMSHAMVIPDTPFEDFKNIAGLFSPQSITEGVKVIDLISQTFHVFPQARSGDVIAEFEAKYAMRFQAVTWQGRSILPVPSLLVSAAAGNQKPGIFDVDTGRFPSGYAFSQDGTGIALRDGHFAADIFGHFTREKETASPFPVRVGNVPIGEARLAVITPGDVDGIKMEGTLGMDLLRRCVIVVPEIQEEKLFFLCKPQTGGSAAP
jgi:hypothetical protein